MLDNTLSFISTILIRARTLPGYKQQGLVTTIDTNFSSSTIAKHAHTAGSHNDFKRLEIVALWPAVVST